MQILICQNLRNNLQHPNEYIRGVTLRFLCRIREEEILEPLVPSILANLDHRCDTHCTDPSCLAHPYSTQASDLSTFTCNSSCRHRLACLCRG